jgi:hypothetical protein
VKNSWNILGSSLFFLNKGERRPFITLSLSFFKYNEEKESGVSPEHSLQKLV